MLDEDFLSKAFSILCCLVSILPMSLSKPEYDALSRVGVGFPLNLNNKTIHYSMGLLQYSYNTDDFKVHRNLDSNSIEILIKKARLAVAFGITRPRREKYNINSKGAVLTLVTRGIAQLSPDGKNAENCRFEFTENEDSKNTQMEKATKEGLFQGLQNSVGRELCDKVRF